MFDERGPPDEVQPRSGGRGRAGQGGTLGDERVSRPDPTLGYRRVGGPRERPGGEPGQQGDGVGRHPERARRRGHQLRQARGRQESAHLHLSPRAPHADAEFAGARHL